MVEEYVTVDVAVSRNCAYTEQHDIPGYVFRGMESNGHISNFILRSLEF